MSGDKYKSSLSIVWLFITALLFCGCSSSTVYEVMQPDPAPLTSFISDSKKLEPQKATFPFDRFWYDKDINWGYYKKIKIMPVDTSNILEDSLWQSANAQSLLAGKEVKEIADYMQKKFTEELKAANILYWFDI